MADIKPLDETPPETQPLPTPYRSVPYSPEGFGAGVGGSVQQAAAALGDVARQAVKEANGTAKVGIVQGGQAAFNQFVADPETGYLSTKGADAISKREDYLSRFNAALDKVGSNLANDEQRLFFQHYANELRTEAVRHIYAHEATQIETVKRATFSGASDQLMTSIQSSISDPVSLDRQFNYLRALATAEGQRRFGNNPQAIQSVVAPVMQKAAIDAMEAASSGGNPDVAKATLERVQPYLLNHERHYSAAVVAMQQKQLVNQQAMQAVSGAAAPVLLPGGMQVYRVDPDKLSAAVLAIPDGPHRDEVAKAIEQRQNVFEAIWKKTVAQQVELARREGDPNSTGQFDMSLVSAARRQWLHDNDDETLIALAKLQDGELARQRAAQRAEDRDAYHQQLQASATTASTVRAQLGDRENREALFATSPEEFQAKLIKGMDLVGDVLPAPLSQKDLASVVKSYRQAQKDAAAGSLDERPEATVRAAIERAADGDPVTAKEIRGQFYDVLTEKARAFVASHKGTVSTDKLAKYVDDELAFGTVKGSGWIFDSRMRRIEAQLGVAKYPGKVFQPEDANSGDPETLTGARPATASPAAAQIPTAPPPPAGRIYVYDSTGKRFTIPAAQRDQALRQGYHE